MEMGGRDTFSQQTISFATASRTDEMLSKKDRDFLLSLL